MSNKITEKQISDGQIMHINKDKFEYKLKKKELKNRMIYKGCSIRV